MGEHITGVLIYSANCKIGGYQKVIMGFIKEHLTGFLFT